MKTAAIVQARMGSTRLPGKVLMPLGEKPVLSHVLTRVRRASRVNVICVATTTEPADTAVSELAQSLEAIVFRGSESDVLGRYLGAARMVEADIILRITADCPLIDCSVLDQLLSLRMERNADYASNGLSLDWPHGLDCEVFTRGVLEAAAAATDDPYDREHVTPWIIREHDAVLPCHLRGPGKPVCEQRWVLDYPEDYIFLQQVFSLFSGGESPWAWDQIWRVVQKHPEISAINAHLRRTALPR